MVTDFRLKNQANTKINGTIYFISIILFCILSISLGIYYLPHLNFYHFLIIPLFLIISNFVEYFLHKYPMHKFYKISKEVYKKHSGLHHKYFSHDNMDIDNAEDVYHVLTSFKVIFIFMFFIIFPISLLFSLVNLGTLFFVSGMIYYLIYEITHFSCHSNTILLKIPYLKSCKERHQIHHNSKLMRTYNFNVSYPLIDKIFKTLKS